MTHHLWEEHIMRTGLTTSAIAVAILVSVGHADIINVPGDILTIQAVGVSPK